MTNAATGGVLQIRSDSSLYDYGVNSLPSIPLHDCVWVFKVPQQFWNNHDSRTRVYVRIFDLDIPGISICANENIFLACTLHVLNFFLLYVLCISTYRYSPYDVHVGLSKLVSYRLIDRKHSLGGPCRASVSRPSTL